MGGSASCLPVSPFSKLGKPKSKVIHVQPLESSEDVKRCQYCNCRNEECRIRQSSDALKFSEKFRNTKSGTGKESIFVEKSQFPFRRPKTLSVKPFIYKHPKPSEERDLLDLGDDYAPRPIYGFYPYKNLQRLDRQTMSEPTTYLHSQDQTPTRFDELQRTRSYNPGPAYLGGPVLPHRAVERLRSTESYQYYSRDTYPPTRFTSHLFESRHNRRPPTPWCPPSRTNDYLVASSLLATEQARDKHLAGHT